MGVLPKEPQMPHRGVSIELEYYTPTIVHKLAIECIHKPTVTATDFMFEEPNLFLPQYIFVVDEVNSSLFKEENKKYISMIYNSIDSLNDQIDSQTPLLKLMDKYLAAQTQKVILKTTESVLRYTELFLMKLAGKENVFENSCIWTKISIKNGDYVITRYTPPFPKIFSPGILYSSNSFSCTNNKFEIDEGFVFLNKAVAILHDINVDTVSEHNKSSGEAIDISIEC